MPVDRDKALAHSLPAGEGGYTRDDVILYPLGVGAGVPATEPGELEYTYEKSLKVLPSFVTTANTGGGNAIFGVPGLEFNPALMLHGEQDVEIHQPLPPEAKLRGQAGIADIYDKGKAALLLVEAVVCKAIVDGALEGDPTRVARYQARFRGVAYPGETYQTSYWREGNKLLVEARVKERDNAIVISNAAVTIRD